MKTSPDALLSIAFRLFVTKGYNETSMQELAKASGMSKGAFHHYFPRKQDILDACLKRFFVDFLPDPDAGADQDVTVLARDAAMKYAQALVLMVEQGIPLAAYQAFLWSQMRDTPELFAARQVAFIGHLTDAFERLHPGKGQALARRFFALIEGTGVFFSINPPDDAQEIPRAFEAMTTEFFDTLARR